MKKSIYLMVMLGCLFAVNGCGSRKEAALLESAVEQEETALDTEGMASENSPSDTLFVYICGAVESPGVYELESGSRICDVLELAGGFSGEADTGCLNLAELVSDGEKVYVPTEDETAGDAAAQEEEASGKVNINTASKEILVTLPGIGESKADSIIAYRTEHGDFSSIEDIMEIPGIKEAVFSKIKELITVN
jgi:competence protein ComEA